MSTEQRNRLRLAVAVVDGVMALTLATSVGAQTPRALSAPVVTPIVKPRTFVDMGYPTPALDQQLQGTAVVRAALDETGLVTSAEALGGPPSLVPAALENVRQWTFEPGSASAIVVYRFEIDYGRCNDDTRGLFRLAHDNMVVLTTCKGPSRHGGVTWTSEPWISEQGTAVYPPIAESARVTGPVVLSLTLDRRGHVTSAAALSGAPLLAPAAIAHARTWRLATAGTLPRQLIVVYEFGLDLFDCPTEAPRRLFRQVDAGFVRLDTCPPLVQVSRRPGDW